jgi:DNA-directed RNA polymerase III subunit RPC1
VYGGDSLDPMMMEGKDKPVDFYRVVEHIKAVSPYAEEDPIDEETIVSSAQELLDGLEGPSKEFKQVMFYFCQSLKM